MKQIASGCLVLGLRFVDRHEAIEGIQMKDKKNGNKCKIKSNMILKNPSRSLDSVCGHCSHKRKVVLRVFGTKKTAE